MWEGRSVWLTGLTQWRHMNEGGAPIRPEAPPCLLHGLNKCATGFTLSMLGKSSMADQRNLRLRKHTWSSGEYSVLRDLLRIFSGKEKWLDLPRLFQSCCDHQVNEFCWSNQGLHHHQKFACNIGFNLSSMAFRWNNCSSSLIHLFYYFPCCSQSATDFLEMRYEIVGLHAMLDYVVYLV